MLTGLEIATNVLDWAQQDVVANSEKYNAAFQSTQTLVAEFGAAFDSLRQKDEADGRMNHHILSSTFSLRDSIYLLQATENVRY